jgi:hypothetical protein
LIDRTWTGSHARRPFGDYLNLYNHKRPHSSLPVQTPGEAYFATLPVIKLAACLPRTLHLKISENCPNE